MTIQGQSSKSIVYRWLSTYLRNISSMISGTIRGNFDHNLGLIR
ncbi:9061_t:CDS:2 [Acaulospora colombiana]|uniref:9061_t:CDS:1 n=1 Tax=Acaulospora colombiana TaxID=27376 RepID=A0ACA9K369_9GLOM|nr:9061_t:CDS:2 [Acaulospora colombiana]